MAQKWQENCGGNNLMVKYLNIFFACVFILFSCSDSKPTKEKQKIAYGAFYDYVNGREIWLVDSLFSNLESVVYRYEHGCVFQFSQPWCTMGKSRILPVILRNENIFIGPTSIDSYRSKLKKEGQDIVYDFSRAEEIIKLLENYKIESVHISHNPRRLDVLFVRTEDSLVSMFYSENEEIHKIRSDSSCMKRGWSVYKEFIQDVNVVK